MRSWASGLIAGLLGKVSGLRRTFSNVSSRRWPLHAPTYARAHSQLNNMIGNIHNLFGVWLQPRASRHYAAVS